MITIEALTAAAREAGSIMLEATDIQSGVEAKEGRANFVTAYDKKVQEFLYGRLTELLPEAAFVGEEEETHAALGHGYAFIVDPIDGTTNFMKGAGCSAVSIGLLLDGEPYMAAVYNPYRDEMFWAQRGKGAYCGKQRIFVSKKPLSDGLVLFGTAPYYRELADKSFEMAKSYFDRSLDVRRSGSAALDLCSVASGRAELFFELRLQPWDFAAGALLISEAGGRITTVDGEPLRFDRPQSVLAVGDDSCG